MLKPYWDGTAETENKIKEKTKATIRCIPIEKSKVMGKCIITGKQSKDKSHICKILLNEERDNKYFKNKIKK